MHFFYCNNNKIPDKQFLAKPKFRFFTAIWCIVLVDTWVQENFGWIVVGKSVTFFLHALQTPDIL